MFEESQPEKKTQKEGEDVVTTESFATDDDIAERPNKKEGEWDNLVEGYDPFDPQEKLAEIRQMNPEAKKEAIAKFKRNLNWQQFVAGQLYESIAGRLAENPDIPKEELKDVVQAAAREGNMTKEQVQKTEQAINAYYARRKEIKRYRETYSNDKRLFEYITNEKPKGEIEIQTRPTTLYIRCYDDEDYAQVYNLGKENVNKDDIEEAKKSQGASLSGGPPALSGAITAERASTAEIEDGKKNPIRAHEEEHAIQRLLRKDIYPTRKSVFLSVNLMGCNTIDGIETETKRQLREVLDIKYHPKMKGEILAYKRGGTRDSNEDIYNTLTKPYNKGGLYWPSLEDKERLASQLKDSIIGDERFQEEAKTVVHKQLHIIFEDELDSTIRKGLEAYEKLNSFGYSHKEISLFFMQEELTQWPKVAARMT